jgi:hypothetical protein
MLAFRTSSTIDFVGVIIRIRSFAFTPPSPAFLPIGSSFFFFHRLG